MTLGLFIPDKLIAKIGCSSFKGYLVPTFKNFYQDCFLIAVF
uniref:Uncharacterized protein n=1 Tax=Curvibacter symbiont subsp. Hydra magnipapillata TaxID=667019 RepID=C9Y942_CURXX|nr:hypothetical protein Csp_A06430 [Curvibacter putative symbiont of Hydra magnipapillata]